MTETTKTSIFLILAVLLFGAAVLTRPVVHEIKMEEMIGKPLFPKFTDPLAVKTLEIVKQNSAGDQDMFRVTEIDGVWSIPSHDNYPADAKDQMGKVAEALVDLKVLDVVASQTEGNDVTALHTLYGVIDPTSENASLGEGIGVKVTLGGAGDEKFVDLIVGKETDAKEKKTPEDPAEPAKLRYVRIAGQVPVYVVEVDPSRFATNFDQWIEKNLLDISSLDVKEIFVDEYSYTIELEMTQLGARERIAPTFIGDMTFGYDSSASGPEKWTLKKWMGFRGTQYEYYERKMKPEEELNTETLDGMVSALNDLKIVSVTKKPSVLAKALREGKPFAEQTGTPDPSLRKSGFCLVPNMPDLRRGTGERAQLLSNEGDIQVRMKDGIYYNLRFGDLTGTESEIPANTNGNTETSEKIPTTMGANRYLFVTAEFDASIIPAPEMKPVPEIPDGLNPDQTETANKEKEQIEKSNQREQERYEKEVEDGKKRAEKLTDRFADWYYVISEDVYKKIHLTQTNVFREKKKESEADQHHEHEHGENHEHKHEITEPKLPNLPGTDGLIKIPGLDEKPAEEPKPVEEPKIEEPKPVEEPKTEEPKPVAESKTEEPKPVEEPKTEEPKPVAEPKTEEPKPVEEPKTEEPKPVEEPKTEEPKPVEEPQPSGTQNE
ncbi:MAG: DUF4340 domain-containing protein [Planctomycetaceae bacterium]|nr:DUF4340 domain-containing protein [Planctomycetaceae bacterium]